jgi:anti-sigma B factor antagonist
MTEQPSHLSVTNRRGVSIVEFADRKILDELCINEIRDELLGLVTDVSGVKLLLSFRNVEHLSSAALGVLITLSKRIAEQGGELRLAEISPQIMEVFKITRLNRLFDIHDTSAGALDSL